MREKNKIKISKDDIIKSYLDYALPTTDAPKIFHQVSAMVMLSTILGRKVYFIYGTQNIFVNMWVILIAPSSTYRKSTSINISKNLIRDNFKNLILPDEFSQEALMEYMDKESSKGLIVWSEFGSFLKATQKQYMVGIKEFFADLYDCPESKKRLLKGSKYEVKKPFINILTATTLDWFVRSIQESDIRGGFLTRFIYIIAKEKDKRKLIAFPPYADREKYKRLKDKLIKVSQIKGVANFSPKAKDLYKKWLINHESSLEKLDNSTGVSSFFARLGVYCLKLSIIFQISSNYKIEVKLNAMRRAISFIEKVKYNIYTLLKEEITFSREERIKKKILDLIKRDRSIDRSKLLQKSGMKSSTLDSYLTTLVEEERIEEVIEPIGYRNRVRYYYKFIN